MAIVVAPTKPQAVETASAKGRLKNEVWWDELLLFIVVSLNDFASFSLLYYRCSPGVAAPKPTANLTPAPDNPAYFAEPWQHYLKRYPWYTDN